jgi:hypothetical protein
VSENPLTLIKELTREAMKETHSELHLEMLPCTTDRSSKRGHGRNVSSYI